MAWAAELGFSATSVGVEMRAPRPGEAAKPIPDLITDQFDTVLPAARNCDVILGANAHQYAAPSIAELIGVPYVNALYAPTALPRDDNVRAWNERARDRVNANRARLGLSSIDDVLRYVVTDHPWLATDATLAAAPAAPDMRILQTGAWMFEDARPLPDDLQAFLDGGQPPVYFGFGSMPVADGTSTLLVEAARAAGRRAIVSRGWGGLAAVDDAPDCMEIDDVNHRALFSRVAAVVHHGGAGTTHTAAYAGVPQVVVPMFGDQPFWAGRVRELGVGGTVLPAELSVERLASALDDAVGAANVERAKLLARHVSPDGARVAAHLLSELTTA
jgi:vancomycin aglycone glucosyltransferase